MKKKIINVLNEMRINYKEYSSVYFLEKKFGIDNVIYVNNKYIEVDDSFHVLVIWDTNGNFIHEMGNKSIYRMMFELGMYIGNK